MESLWIALIIFLVLAAVAVVVGGVVFLFLRFRKGQDIQISLRLLLRLYLFVIIIVGLVLLTQGFSGLVRAGLAGAGGNDFSYRPVFAGKVFERPPLDPLELREPKDLSREELEELARIRNKRDEVNREQQLEQRREGLDRALKEGIIEGITFAIIGAIIWGVHIEGRRRLETKKERESALNRLYLISVVVIFGVITLVNLPQAVSETVRFYVLDFPDEFSRPSPPGGKLALSIATLPLWIAYLVGAIGAVRRGS